MGLTKKDIVFPDVPHHGRIGGIMGDTPWKTMWQVTCNEWRRTVDAYETDPGDFYAAWYYLDEHPAFWRFRHGPTDAQPYSLRRRLHRKHLEVQGGINRCVRISVHKVNETTRSTEDGPPLETEIWVETGQYSWPKEVNPKDPETFDSIYHDHLLDTGGPTVEDAILRTAHNVWQVYGNDRRVCDAPYDEMAYVTVVDQEHFEELMAERGDDGEINEQVRRAAQRLNEIVGRDNRPTRRKNT